MNSKPESNRLEQTLAERGGRYGTFEHHATLVQTFKKIAEAAPSWYKMTPWEKQALEVIFDKIARMLNGDPHYLDNWHDIQGYAKLVEDILNAYQNPTASADTNSNC